MQGTFYYFLKFLPFTAFTAIVFAWFGWWLRGRSLAAPCEKPPADARRPEIPEHATPETPAIPAKEIPISRAKRQKGKRIAVRRTENPAAAKPGRCNAPKPEPEEEAAAEVDTATETETPAAPEPADKPEVSLEPETSTESPRQFPAKNLHRAAELWGRPILKNDLTVILGISTRIAGILQRAGIRTWAELAASEEPHLRDILRAAGARFAEKDPSSWPEQARLAEDAAWDELREMQDSRPAAKPPEKSDL